MVLEAQLQECNGLVLGKTLAVHPQDRRRVAGLYGLAKLLHFGWTFNQRVAFGRLLLVSLDLRPYLGDWELLIGLIKLLGLHYSRDITIINKTQTSKKDTCPVGLGLKF